MIRTKKRNNQALILKLNEMKFQHEEWSKSYQDETDISSNDDRKLDSPCNEDSFLNLFKEEESNKLLRREMLHTGKKELISKIEKLNQKKKMELENVCKINSNQESIRSEIDLLEEKIKNLEKDKVQILDKCKLIDSRIESEQNKIQLLERTLEDLNL